MNLCRFDASHQVWVQSALRFGRCGLKNFKMAAMAAILDIRMEQILAVLNLFVCVEVLRPSQPNGVMSSTVSLPNHTFTGQA